MPLTEEERQRIQTRLQGGTTPSPSGVLPPEIEALVGSVTGTPAYLRSMSPRGGTVVPARPSGQVQGEMRNTLLLDQARERLKNLNKPSKATPTGQLTAFKSTNQAIRRLKNLIQTIEQKGYKTGPLSPRFQRGTLGNIAMQYRGTPEERAFKAENERFANDYITAQTGAQRGFKEMAWLQTAIPNASADTPENYLANAYSALKDLEDDKQQMTQMLEEGGYKAPTLADEEDKVRMKSPTGQVGRVPREQVEAAESQGYTVVP